MTRRRFAGLLAFILPVAVANQRTIRASDNQSAGSKRHIENRRLFDFTAGAIPLEEFEREHVHQCGICQKTAYAYLRSGFAS